MNACQKTDTRSASKEILAWLLIVATLICCTSASGQGLYFNRGQSGIHFAGGACYGSDTYKAAGAEVGWTLKGDVTFGLGVSHASMKETSVITLYGGPSYSHSMQYDVWDCGFFITEYVLRSQDGSGRELVMSLSQALSWLSQDLPPVIDPLHILHLGGGVAYSIPAGHQIRFYLDGAFAHAIPDIGPSYSTVNVGLNMRVPLKRGCLVFGPTITRSDDITTYGANFGLVNNGPGKKRTTEFR